MSGTVLGAWDMSAQNKDPCSGGAHTVAGEKQTISKLCHVRKWKIISTMEIKSEPNERTLKLEVYNIK